MAPFDANNWQLFVQRNSYAEAPIQKTVSFDQGKARIQADTITPEGPGVMAYGNMCTKQRVFSPDLKGTNLFEFTLEDYSHSGPFLNKYIMRGDSSDFEDPVKGSFVTGFGLAISSFQGMVGDKPVSRRIAPEDTVERVVQIHFDWFSKAGIFFYLGRNIVAGDTEKIPLLDRELNDRIIENKIPRDYTFPEMIPNITLPGHQVTQAQRFNPAGDNCGWGHRYGLQLTDDGNTLSWLMDGKMMDTVDISGFFSSSPGCVADGAFATIVGGGSYEQNTWTLSDLRIE
jgi:hypothetical protein